jgi:hypothetical protein
MSDPVQRAAVEAAVAAVPGVRALYPLSVVPGAARVALDGGTGAPRCRLRLAADLALPVQRVVRDVAVAVRRSLGSELALVQVEIASID